MKTAPEIQADFDKIALVDRAEGWNHNTHYHGFLLRQLPTHLKNSLDVGCGMGAFARLLAARSDHVLALDLSPEMLYAAGQRSRAYPNIEYAQADVMAYPLPDDHFDCIASIATLHHLSLEDVLPKLKAALKPGGTLLVLDLFDARTLREYLIVAAGVPMGMVLKNIFRKNRVVSPAARAAWEAHGQSDVYRPLSEIRRVCDDVLPGAKVTQHLLWRYSLVWRKP